MLASELYPGRFHPTVAHVFVALLARRGLLRMLFTQNIDCLERATGVPPDKIVEAHGSFATQRCIDCGTPFPDDLMRRFVQEGKVPCCHHRLSAETDASVAVASSSADCDAIAVNWQREATGSTTSEWHTRNGVAADSQGPSLGTQQPLCRGLVKPDIVFFGESLPPRFFAEMRVVSGGATGSGSPATVEDPADLILILGTSLTVHPFASLPELAPRHVPRVLFNLERVGGLGYRPDDVLCLGGCDSGVRALAAELGWAEELEEMWEAIVGREEAERQRAASASHVTAAGAERDEVEELLVNERGEAVSRVPATSTENDEILEREVQKITEDVERVLALKAAATGSSDEDDDSDTDVQSLFADEDAQEATTLASGTATGTDNNENNEEGEGKPRPDSAILTAGGTASAPLLVVDGHGSVLGTLQDSQLQADETSAEPEGKTSHGKGRETVLGSGEFDKAAAETGKDGSSAKASGAGKDPNEDA